MRRAREHRTARLRHEALTEENWLTYQVGDRVLTVDGIAGEVVGATATPFGSEYEVVLDDGLGGGTYIERQIVGMEPRDVSISAVASVWTCPECGHAQHEYEEPYNYGCDCERCGCADAQAADAARALIEHPAQPYKDGWRSARRYSDTPLVCDGCGRTATCSISGGRDGHTMLCPECAASRSKTGRTAATVRQTLQRINQHAKSVSYGASPRSSVEYLLWSEDLTATSPEDAARAIERGDLVDFLPISAAHTEVHDGSVVQVNVYNKDRYGRDLLDTQVYWIDGDDLWWISYRGNQKIAAWNGDYNQKIAAWNGDYNQTIEVWSEIVRDPAGPSYSVLRTDGQSPYELKLDLSTYFDHESGKWGVTAWDQNIGADIGSTDFFGRNGVRYDSEAAAAKAMVEFAQSVLKAEQTKRNRLTREVIIRTGARADLPLAPRGAVSTAEDDYPELDGILWDRPDHVEAVPVSINQVSLAKAASKTAGPARTLDDTIQDKSQPLWWRKVVGPAVQRVNDKLDPRYRMDDIRRPPTVDWCRFRREGHCYFPKALDEEGTRQAGYAVWIPEDRGKCARLTHEQQASCEISEPGPNSGEALFGPDGTRRWSEGGQRYSSLSKGASDEH